MARKRTDQRARLGVRPLVLAALVVSGAATVVADGDAGRTPGIVQKDCPILIGKEIRWDIFWDYNGKRVYFCCEPCRETFRKDPETYLHRLPQFAAAGAAGTVSRDEHGHRRLSAASLIAPMGIATLCLVALTVALGLFRRLSPRVMLTWHKRVGPLALLAGAIHALLVLLVH